MATIHITINSPHGKFLGLLNGYVGKNTEEAKETINHIMNNFQNLNSLSIVQKSETITIIPKSIIMESILEFNIIE